VLSHELDRNRKLIAETMETRLSDFVDSDGGQGHHRHLMRELLLRPSDVWVKDRQEP
jgi:hypothetical protein